MSGGFEDLLKAMVFFCVIWTAGKFVERFKVPELVGQILMGSVLGPTLYDFAPEHDALVLLGEIGLVLLTVEAGLEVDLVVLKRVGFRGLMIGILGSLVPLAIAFGFATALGLSTKSALTVGACFAPTSMGVAIVVLKNGGIINSPMGQMVIAAAVADDVMALIMLSELRALQDPSPLNFVLPILSAFLFAVTLGSTAVYIVPHVMEHYLPKINEKPTKLQEIIILGGIFFLTIGLMAALQYSKSSYLLGAFLSGLCFCTVHAVEHVWKSQLKRIIKWLLRIFFASTVGFSVPLSSFSSPKVILTGLLFFVTVIGKLCLGVFASPLQWSSGLMVGFAMSTWGEFAFIIAVEGKKRGLLSTEIYSSIVFAILLSILISPFILRNIIAYFSKQHVSTLRGIMNENLHHGQIYYKLYIRLKSTWGFQTSLIQLLANNQLECIEFSSHFDQDMSVYEAYVKDKQLYDSTPETEDAEGLIERLIQLREILKQYISSCDPTCDISHLTGDIYLEDFNERLHGFTLLRWLPGNSPEEWALYGTDETKALDYMLRQGFQLQLKTGSESPMSNTTPHQHYV